MKILLMLLLLSGAAHAQSTHALIVTGLAGEPRIAQDLQRDGVALRDAVAKRFGGTAVLLSATSTPRSDRAAIQQAFAGLATSSAQGDRILVVLMGHASAEGEDPRFNIPGPDITAADLAKALNGLSNRSVAVVMATTSSGAFLPALSEPGRIVITATRSGRENEEVVFPRFFANALANDGADTNKDGGVSLAEAFDFARRETTRFYEQAKRLPTEHALLEDNGDGKGSLDIAQGEDGAAARRFVLKAGGSSVTTAAPPADARRTALEKQIADLRARKATMEAAAYDAELESLLLQLARLNREIRAAEEKQ